MNRLLIICGTICTALWGFITAMTFGIPQAWCDMIDRMTFGLMTDQVNLMTNGFYYDLRNNDMPTVMFLILFSVIFFIVVILISIVKKKPANWYSLGIIIFFSVVMRLIVLPGVMIHENDIYRYVWDGKATLNGINPYTYAPADLFMYEEGEVEDYYDEYRDVVITVKEFSKNDVRNLDALIALRDKNPLLYERIGHWQVPTIYPPVAQILFPLPVLISEHSFLPMKAFFVLFDLGSLVLIILLLRHFGKNPNMCIAYGWSPLVLLEIANAGHYDSIPIFFTLLCLLLFFKGKQWGGTFVLSLATLSKFFSGVLLPIVLRPFKLRYLALFGIIIGISYLPYMIWDQTGMGGVFKGLMTYNDQWSYNASIFKVIHNILKTMPGAWGETLMPAKVICGLLYLGTLAYLTFKKNMDDWSVLHKCFLAIAILFIVNPVADPWYYCWVIPFLCFFPYRSWYLLSGLLALSYLNFHSDYAIVDREFWGISLIAWITYLPFYTLMAIEFFHTKCKETGSLPTKR